LVQSPFLKKAADGTVSLDFDYLLIKNTKADFYIDRADRLNVTPSHRFSSTGSLERNNSHIANTFI